MEKLTYTIIGNLNEITDAIDTARTEDRFLSDVPNVVELIWHATGEDTAEATISVNPDTPIAPDELAIFTAEYPSLAITTSFDDAVQTLTVEGIKEQVA